MKKLLLAIAAICAITFSANAQFYATGSIGFNLYSADGVSSSSWHIDPGVGYSFSEKSSAGLYLSLGGVSSSFEWSVNPYYRYTFSSVQNIHFFTDAEFSIGQASKTTHWGVGIVPGVSYTLSERLNLVARIGHIGIEGVDGNTAFRLNLLDSSTFGLEFKF